MKTIHKVSAVLRLIDDFTGKSISDCPVNFFHNNRRILPIKKADGLYVITDELLSDSSILVASPYYCSVVVTNFEQLVLSNPVMTLRLLPSSMYRLTGGPSYSTVIRNADGSPAVGNVVEIHAIFHENMVRIISLENNIISLTNPYNIDFTGLVLSIEDESKKYRLKYTVKEHIDSTHCVFLPSTERQMVPLGENSKTYKTPKSLKPLIPSPCKRVYMSITDTNGFVQIPYHKSPKSDSNNDDLIIYVERK